LSESEAIEKFRDEDINPADMDMDIEELVDGNNCYSVIGFYKDTNEKYNGVHQAFSSVEAEKQASQLGVTVCAVIEGAHKSVDNKKYLN